MEYAFPPVSSRAGGRWARPQDIVADDIQTALTDHAGRRYVAAST